MKKIKQIVFVFLIVILASFVTINGCKKLSTQKAITSFAIISLNPQVIGVINENAKTIEITVPNTTDVTKLVSLITISDKATIYPNSGIEQNFTMPIVYTVTAEDGSVAKYTVTVTKSNNSNVDLETLGGTMSQNVTLSDKGLPIDYVINGMLYIDGNALLTIEPGVKIVFTGVDGGIEVGENAGLKMIGTPEKPIVFSGPINNQNKGSWRHIRYYSNRADNVMEYVQLLNGGAGNMQDNKAVLHVEGALAMKNCLIDASACNGIVVEGQGNMSQFERNIISNSNEYPIVLNKIKQVMILNETNTFNANAINMIKIFNAGTDEVDIIVKALQIPYYFEDNIYVEKIFTIEAGTNLLFKQGTHIEIAEAGKIIAVGTADKHIKMNGITNNIGCWGGILLASTQLGNKIIYCDIAGGGASDGWTENHNIYIRTHTKLLIQNTTISKSNYYGIVIEDKTSANMSLTHANVAFSECRLGNVYDESSGEVTNALP